MSKTNPKMSKFKNVYFKKCLSRNISKSKFSYSKFIKFKKRLIQIQKMSKSEGCRPSYGKPPPLVGRFFPTPYPYLELVQIKIGLLKFSLNKFKKVHHKIV